MGKGVRAERTASLQDSLGAKSAGDLNCEKDGSERDNGDLSPGGELSGLEKKKSEKLGKQRTR